MLQNLYNYLSFTSPPPSASFFRFFLIHWTQTSWKLSVLFFLLYLLCLPLSPFLPPVTAHPSGLTYLSMTGIPFDDPCWMFPSLVVFPYYTTLHTNFLTYNLFFRVEWQASMGRNRIYTISLSTQPSSLDCASHLKNFLCMNDCQSYVLKKERLNLMSQFPKSPKYHYIFCNVKIF